MRVLGDADDEVTHHDAVLAGVRGEVGEQVRSDDDARAVRPWPCEVVVADVVLCAPHDEGEPGSVVILVAARRPGVEPKGL